MYIISGVLTNLTSLRVLDLSHNKLRNLTFEEPLPELNEIYLAHNDIFEVSWKSFLELKNLSRLDISSNNLSYIDSKIVANIKSGLVFQVLGNIVSKKSHTIHLYIILIDFRQSYCMQLYS